MTTAALSVYNCTYVPPTTPRNQLDGDTFRCIGDVRPIVPDMVQWVPKVRLIRVDAPESGDPGANEARDALINWLHPKPFNLICYARDKYGRLLADAEHGDGLLSDYLLSLNLVAPMSVAQAKTLVLEPTPDLLAAIAHPSTLTEG